MGLSGHLWLLVFVDLAHSEGFEPSTARFVAEYSIQLSYECVRPRNILISGF